MTVVVKKEFHSQSFSRKIISIILEKKNRAMKKLAQNIVPSMIDAFVAFAVGIFFGPIG